MLGMTGVTLKVDLVISLTLIVEVTLAKMIGCSLPIIAKRLKLDPAVMSSPFVTTIVDAISLLIYFGFATAVLCIFNSVNGYKITPGHTSRRLCARGLLCFWGAYLFVGADIIRPRAAICRPYGFLLVQL